ncbi:RAMP superfamily CRISPR-associated protein [Fusobacterium polymorphum]|jgi:hypothetical protein|uniref:RAMP superfamily CRISPR-associated protein n=1 Tax=Fusobacterium nucleatum subsp. polymorphum TaxID=76857 RepID=UPI001C6F29C9|nr:MULTISPECIES: RAMP superfamily CRISPR-associated protein [Fusobacterium]QYR60768.1 hypothetical protein JY402_09235 [Fusobacterium polymorphum]WCB31507.1 RAMP superfamily CRISPR-associated protein [Fusobacterium nucleatum]
MDFSIFNNKYIIKGRLKVLTALHIGSGVEEDGHDAPFITVDKSPKNKIFYIPGSSFRGYLSTKLERLLAKENNYRFVTDSGILNEADVKLIFGYTNLQNEDDNIKDKVLENLGYDKNNKDDKEENYYSMAGKIHISDMFISSEVDTIKRDGIKIDRNTGATKKGGKFDYDVLPPGTEFEFVMELDNIEDYQLDLIKLALIDILEGDLFGGKISRGIGKCKLILNEVEFIDAKNKQDLENYIFKKDMRKIVSKKDDKEVEKNEEFKKFFEIKKLKLGK